MVDKPAAPKAEAPATEPSLDDVRQDLDRLREEVSRLLEALGKGAQKTMEEVKVEAEAKMETAEAWAEGRCHSAREAIRAQPLAACALAAGLGLILGQILLRR